MYYGKQHAEDHLDLVTESLTHFFIFLLLGIAAGRCWYENAHKGH